MLGGQGSICHQQEQQLLNDEMMLLLAVCGSCCCIIWFMQKKVSEEEGARLTGPLPSALSSALSALGTHNNQRQQTLARVSHQVLLPVCMKKGEKRFHHCVFVCTFKLALSSACTKLTLTSCLMSRVSKNRLFLSFVRSARVVSCFAWHASHSLCSLLVKPYPVCFTSHLPRHEQGHRRVKQWRCSSESCTRCYTGGRANGPVRLVAGIRSLFLLLRAFPSSVSPVFASPAPLLHGRGREVAEVERGKYNICGFTNFAVQFVPVNQRGNIVYVILLVTCRCLCLKHFRDPREGSKKTHFPHPERPFVHLILPLSLDSRFSRSRFLLTQGDRS